MGRRGYPLCASTGEQRSMSLFKTQAELTLKPLVFDLVYRLSQASSAYILKSDMDGCLPVDAVLPVMYMRVQGNSITFSPEEDIDMVAAQYITVEETDGASEAQELGVGPGNEIVD